MRLWGLGSNLGFLRGFWSSTLHFWGNSWSNFAFLRQFWGQFWVQFWGFGVKLCIFGAILGQTLCFWSDFGASFGIWGQTLHFWGDFGANFEDLGSNFAFLEQFWAQCWRFGVQLCILGKLGAQPLHFFANFCPFPPVLPPVLGFFGFGVEPSVDFGCRSPKLGSFGGRF